MERKRAKLRNDDTVRTTSRYNTRSSSRQGISNTSTVDESASLRVTKQRKKNKKISDERSKKSDLHLTTDLIIEILKRLPVKSLARFLSVSKVWGSIIRSRDFKKLFLHESSNRPARLFFTFKRKENDCFLLSSNPGESTHHIAHPVCESPVKSSSCVHDLICYQTHSNSELVLYNSTTKRSFTFPKLDLSRSFLIKHFLGYDPIDAVYKVMCICLASRPVLQVLTLGNGNEWREVEYPHGYLPCNNHVCIDGVLYFDAYADLRFQKPLVISLDVRSEKFHPIKGPAGDDFPADQLSTMTCYEGKLAFTSFQVSADGSMVLWVLEDATKRQWLKKVFVLPNSWTSLAQYSPIPAPPHELHYFVSITVSGEFILAPVSTCVPPFYVLYYDPKSNSVRKVSIEGIMEHELLQWNEDEPWFIHHVFSSEVESLMFW